MKTLVLILALAILPHFCAKADIGVFGAFNDSSVCCIDNQVAGAYISTNEVVNLEAFVAAKRMMGVGVNVKVGDFRLGVGRYEDALRKDIDVAGVPVSAKDTGQGDLMYVQWDFAPEYFVRVSRAHNSYDLSATRCIRVCDMKCVQSATSNEHYDVYSNWLWFGVRF